MKKIPRTNILIFLSDKSRSVFLTGMVAFMLHLIHTIPGGAQTLNVEAADFQAVDKGKLEFFIKGVFNDKNNNSRTDLGETISYSFRIVNTGNFPLTDVAVTDPMLDLPDVKIIIEVDEADSTTFFGDYAVLQSDIDAGLVNNTATVVANEIKPLSAQEITFLMQDPGLTISGNAVFDDTNNDGNADAGEAILYDYTISNTGNTVLTGVYVDDPEVTISGDRITLDVGETSSGHFSGTYFINQEDINRGEFVNNTSAYADNLTAVQYSESIILVQEAQLSFSKSGSFNDENSNGIPNAGETISYSFRLENTGNITLTNITVTDEFAEVTGAPLTLDPGQVNETQFEASYTITQNDINAGVIENTALAISDQTNEVTAVETITLLQDPELVFSITSLFNDENGNGSADAGESITFGFTLENIGNVLLDNVHISSFPVQVTGDPVSISPGETANTAFSAEYVLTQEDINAGQVEVTATASSDQVSPVSATALITLEQQASLSLTKSGVFNDANNDGKADAGETIDYVFTVENTGNVTLTNITVTDPLIPVSGGPITLEVGALDNTTFRGSYSITLEDILNGEVVNTATAESSESEPATAGVTVTLPQLASLTFIKTGIFNDENEDGSADEGETITYSFTIENTGNIPITGITLTDELVNVEGSLAILEPGMINQDAFSATYTITQADINAGEVVNTATAQSLLTGPVSSTFVTELGQEARIGMIKTGTFDDANANGLAESGELVAYELTVENTGNVILYDVNVTENQEDFTGSGTLPQPVLESGGAGLGGNSDMPDLAPGEQMIYSFSYQLTQDDVDAGSVSNRARVEAADPAGTTIFTFSDDNSNLENDPTVVTLPQEASLSMSKSAEASGFGVLNEEVLYRIVIENTGNVTLENISLVDEKTRMAANVEELQPGESEEYLTIYNVRQADLDNGTILNEVVAIFTFNGVDYEEKASSVLNSYSQPMAQNDLLSGLIPGNNAEINILNNDRLGNGEAVLPSAVTVQIINPSTGNPATDPHSYISEGEGEWSYNPETGVLTFDPFDGFTTDPSPVEYQLVELSTGLGDRASVTVEYEEQPPNAVNDNSTGNAPGENVVLNIIENDQISDGTSATLQNTQVTLIDPGTGDPAGNLLEVEGEGLWTYNPANGQILFNPETGYTTDPAPVFYRLTEVLTGLNDDAQISVDYTGAEPAAVNDNVADIRPGDNAVILILDNDQLSDGSPATTANTTVALIDPDSSEPSATPYFIDVEGEGTWQYNSDTGELVFNPDEGFTIDPAPIDYSLTELLTGLSDEATVSVGYTRLNPVAENDVSEENQAGTSVLIAILENDRISDQTQATVENTTIQLLDPETGNVAENRYRVVVEGEGEWVFNPSSGFLQFIPIRGFSENPDPLNYILTEELTGLNDQATVTINYAVSSSLAGNDISTGHIPGYEAIIDILANDQLSDGSQALASDVTVRLIDPENELPVASGRVDVAGQGEWRYNTQMGEVIFDPDPGFTTDPDPLSYELTENSTGITATATIHAEYDERPPFAVDDTVSRPTLGMSILANDLLSDSTTVDVLKVSVALVDPQTGQVAVPEHTVAIEGQGEWRFNSLTGILTFVPLSGFSSSPASIEYVLTEDLTSLSSRAMVYTSVAAANFDAQDDSVSLDSPAQTAVIDILENDQLSDGSKARASLVQVALLDPETDNPGLNPYYLKIDNQGEWTYNPLTGTVRFEPADNLRIIPEVIRYRLTEIRTGITDVARIVIDIPGLNNPPVTEDDNYSMGDCRNLVMNVLLNDSDPDEDQLGIPEIGISPEAGTVMVHTDGTIEYIPERGYQGTDTFSYILCDTRDPDLCSEATVTVTIETDTDCDSIINRIDEDDDNDGIPDVDEGSVTADFDDDDIPNYLDIDSDNDGITDNTEWQPEGNYLPPVYADVNENGWDDAYDPEMGGTYVEPVDTDNDNKPDFLDLDSDDDNVPDFNEGFDADFDAEPDFIAAGNDMDQDGLDDVYDIVNGWSNQDNPLGSNQVLKDFDDDGLRDWRDSDDDNDGRPTTGVDNKYSDEQCDLLIPEIFSPNNDGVQDYFRIVCIDKYPEAKIEIFNRWGALVYEQEQYGNIDTWGTTDAWWDGHSKKNSNDDNILPSGTYFYVLHLNDGSKPMNGFIFLNR